MPPAVDPFSLFRSSLALWRLGVAAQTVVTLRMMGAAGLVPAARGENGRMLSEKPPAFLRAGLAAQRAVLTGAPPLTVLDIWTGSLARAVGANRRRLTRGSVRRLPGTAGGRRGR